MVPEDIDRVVEELDTEIRNFAQELSENDLDIGISYYATVRDLAGLERNAVLHESATSLLEILLEEKIRRSVPEIQIEYMGLL